jgi:hypothetical protein
MFRGTKQQVQCSKANVLDEQVGQNIVLSVMFFGTNSPEHCSERYVLWNKWPKSMSLISCSVEMGLQAEKLSQL